MTQKPDATDVHVEAQRILKLVGGDALGAFQMLERQMSVLVLRTQVMLSLSGIVITVTGFSGRAIALTSTLARGAIAAGLFVVLAAALVAVAGVLRLRWLTQQLEDDTLEMLVRGLAVRNAKAHYLGVALALFGLGFTLYCVAIVQLLLAATPPA
jgi:hypothetical protein